VVEVRPEAEHPYTEEGEEAEGLPVPAVNADLTGTRNNIQYYQSQLSKN
jgi:hypothetical protein